MSSNVTSGVDTRIVPVGELTVVVANCDTLVDDEPHTHPSERTAGQILVHDDLEHLWPLMCRAEQLRR